VSRKKNTAIILLHQNMNLKCAPLTPKRKSGDGRLKIKLGRIHKLEFNVKSISINQRKDD
jgi:hypothetical protein